MGKLVCHILLTILFAGLTVFNAANNNFTAMVFSILACFCWAVAIIEDVKEK